MAHTLLIVGGGKMGSALLGGLLASGWVAPEQVVVAETSAPRRRRADGSSSPGVRVVDAPEAAGRRRWPRRCRARRQAGRGRRGLPGPRGRRGDARAVHRRRHPRLRLETALGGQPSVVRAMPNTPALVRSGVTALSGGSHATSADLAWAEEVMGAVGTVVRLPERLLDPVTGLSGSGPAYFFLVAEALIDAGVQMGLTRDVSRTLVVETMLGSATLLAETGEEPAVLRAMVTSPAGTTAAGVRALEARAVRSAFMEAVAAATERSRSLHR